MVGYSFDHYYTSWLIDMSLAVQPGGTAGRYESIKKSLQKRFPADDFNDLSENLSFAVENAFF